MFTDTFREQWKFYILRAIKILRILRMLKCCTPREPVKRQSCILKPAINHENRRIHKQWKPSVMLFVYLVL